MFNQQKLIGYHAGKTFLHALSGASKLIFFILVSVAAMMSYDAFPPSCGSGFPDVISSV